MKILTFPKKSDITKAVEENNYSNIIIYQIFNTTIAINPLHHKGDVV